MIARNLVRIAAQLTLDAFGLAATLVTVARIALEAAAEDSEATT